jgi:DNA-binding beta-propeller fold protein YncE
MNDLQDLLERLADAGETRTPDAVFAAARSRGTRVRRRRIAARLAGACAAAACVVIIVSALVSGSTSPRPRVTTRGTEPPAAVRPPLDTIPLAASPTPPLVAAAGGRLWVAEPGVLPAHGRLLEIDPATGAVEHRTTLAGDLPYAIGAGADAVWVRSQLGEEYTKLEKIDGSTHRVVATIPFSVDGGLAVADDAVWAIDGTGTLMKLDPATGRVDARIPLPRDPYAAPVVSTGKQGVLLANAYDGTLLRVDGATVRTIATLPAGRGRPSWLVQLDDAAWVGAGRTLTPLLADGSMGSPPLDVGAQITAIAGTGHTLWVATANGLVHVDTQNDLIEHVMLPHGADRADDVTVDPATNDVWVVVDHPRRLVRFDADAPFTGGSVVAEPRQQPELAEAVPTGCPPAPLTPAPADENTRSAVIAAAIDYTRHDRFWAETTIDAFYRVDRPAGAVGDLFATNLPRCGPGIAEQTYAVEMNNPLITQSNARIAQVVVSHFADGWRVWGYYH